MATIRFDGLEACERKLAEMGNQTRRLAKMALYEGAGVMADAIREATEALPVVHGFGTDGNPLPGGVTGTQKAGLLEGLGISPMEEEGGGYTVKIGFDGYNDVKTKKYPNGQPNALVARGIESGTSWKKKNPYIRRTVKAKKAEVERAMIAAFDRELEKLNK